MVEFLQSFTGTTERVLCALIVITGLAFGVAVTLWWSGIKNRR